MRKGEQNLDYLPVPLAPVALDMAPRRAPVLPSRWNGLHLAEGEYAELVAEYRVPARTPFLLESGDIYIRTLLASVGFKCLATQRVYQFRENADYEVVVGAFFANGTSGLMCPFSVYEIGAKGRAAERLAPLPLMFVAASEAKCDAP